jgi:hypothetical protein
MQWPRLRFTVRELMIAVVVVAVLLGVLKFGFYLRDEYWQAVSYGYNPDESRLAIGQEVVTYSKDGARIPVASGLAPGLRCRVTYDRTDGDRDDMHAYRDIGIEILEGTRKGETLNVERRYLRVPES